MQYRQAQFADHEQIALLHADSWRRTYRGLFSDQFLDHDASRDRLQVWAQRLHLPAEHQAVIVADDGHGSVQGFICIYGDEDPHWGSLIDNLHVRQVVCGQGIGSQLMANAFAWLAQTYPANGVYLWVMQSNQAAREFYARRGARNAGVVDKPNPVGGGSASNCRYVWGLPREYIVPHCPLE